MRSSRESTQISFFSFLPWRQVFYVFSHVWQFLWYASHASSGSCSIGQTVEMGNSVWLTFAWVRPGSRLQVGYELTVEAGASACFRSGGKSGVIWTLHCFSHLQCRWREEPDQYEYDCSLCKWWGLRVSEFDLQSDTDQTL